MNVRRFASLAGTVAVTVIAAAASYDHTRKLAEMAGQPPILAALLPLSVDGLVLVGTAAIGDGRRRTGSAWAAFMTGVAASLAANVMAAEPNTLSRLVSAWPAVALLLTVEILARSGQDGRHPTSATQPVVEGGGDTPDTTPTPAVAPVVMPVTLTTASARVRHFTAITPGAAATEIAVLARCSERTVHRVWKTAGDEHADTMATPAAR